jgi:hypothetical protein
MASASSSVNINGGSSCPRRSTYPTPALCFERLKALALDHLGGSAETDDVAVFNRLTGATMATHLTLVRPGNVVIGVSASHSHPSVVRAAEHVGAQFIDTAGLAAFRDAMATQRPVALAALYLGIVAAHRLFSRFRLPSRSGTDSSDARRRR